MLRCGQMILGEALVCTHVGRGKASFQILQEKGTSRDFFCKDTRRSSHWVASSPETRLTGLISCSVFSDWRWARGQEQREEYISILNAFIDKKDSYYSIHQIGE